MDGDLAPLPQLSEAAAAAGATLIVDDAHGLGVMGATGRGCLEHFGLDSRAVPVLVGTLGKAFGCFGAFIAADADYIEWFLQTARSYIYTTALPPPVAAAARAALAVAATESWRRVRVLELAARLRHGCAQAGIALLPSPSPIQPVVLGDSKRALAVSEHLFAAGFWVTAIAHRPYPKAGAACGSRYPPPTASNRSTRCSTHWRPRCAPCPARLRMQPPDPFVLDRRAVRVAFDRASGTYDAAAGLQTRVRAELLSRLELIRMVPQIVVDIGCGTGQGARALKKPLPERPGDRADPALGMLRETRRRSGCCGPCNACAAMCSSCPSGTAPSAWCSAT